MARGAGAKERRDLMRETTCKFCGDPILHVRVDYRAASDAFPGVSMPPGTYARLDPQPDDDGWYVVTEEWIAYDPEMALAGVRHRGHNC